MFTFSSAEALALPSASLEESAPMPTEGKTVEEMIIISVMLHRYETVLKETYIRVLQSLITSDWNQKHWSKSIPDWNTISFPPVLFIAKNAA